MLQQWNLRSRAHQCAVTERPFEDGEKHYTAIYFDPETSGYSRRDVAFDAWKQELSERKPFSFWKSVYVKNAPDERPEITSKESGLSLLQHMLEEDEPHTENARYILALMLERKRILSPTAVKETELGRMLFYENKKTGDAFVIRDPELRLDEIAGLQEEVATLLGFAGPGTEPPKKGRKSKSEVEVAPPADTAVETPSPMVEEAVPEAAVEAPVEEAETALEEEKPAEPATE